MPITAPVIDAERYWSCVCIYCSNKLERKQSMYPKVKGMLDAHGWAWFRLAASQLEAVCPAHLEALRTETQYVNLREWSENLFK